MNKTVLIACLSIIYQFVLAQAPLKINNTITGKHQRVEGTKIYMVIPEDFEPVQEMIGFRQTGTENSMIIRESVGSYKELVQTFMTENLTIRGLKIEETQKLSINGDEATFYRLTQKVHRTTFTKLLLFFGDYDYCVLISAVMAQKDGKNIEDQIKQSMLSVAYKEENESQPMPKNFSFDLGNTGLKFARSFSEAVIYSVDGKTSTNALTEYSLFAGESKLKEGEDKKAFALERIQKQSKSPVTIQSQQEITVDGLSGYEIIANTTTDGKNRSLYQTLLYRGEQYFIFFGSSTDAAKTTDFQAITKTFKIK